MEIIMQTSKSRPFQINKTIRNPLYFRRIALFEKSEINFSESLRESINGINVVSDNSNPADHSYHALIP